MALVRRRERSNKNVAVCKFAMFVAFVVLTLILGWQPMDSTLNIGSIMPTTLSMQSTANVPTSQKYVPASTEDYIMNHFDELNYTSKKVWGAGCNIYKSAEFSTAENFKDLNAYKEDLKRYTQAIKDFDASATTKDLLKKIRHGSDDAEDQQSQIEICKALRPHPDGIQALFPSGQLSLTKNGFVEPLLTPQRSPFFCDKEAKSELTKINYLVHDFETMCLRLKPQSKLILIDMGASLTFSQSGRQLPPMIELLSEYEKAGLIFDHIYAFEVTHVDPTKVYNELLPQKYHSSYHWINTGVSAEKDGRMNPLYSIISKLHEDDLVVVKLDIDTPEIENPMAKLLLEDDAVNHLVDHFYFEHHVRLYELRAFWGANPTFKNIRQVPTIADSFQLMNGLRKKGVAAHFWV